MVIEMEAYNNNIFMVTKMEASNTPKTEDLELNKMVLKMK